MTKFEWACGMRLPNSALLLLTLGSAFAGSSAGSLDGLREMLRSAGLDTSNIVVLQGPSTEFGIAAIGQPVPTRNEEDLRAPELQIVWERTADIPAYSLPASARVFSRERWKHAPLMAGWKQGEKIYLWTAVDPGESGYERFPYLPQAAMELGAMPLARSNRLWAFFDGSYRARADVDFLAPRWKQAGIAALHVAAWHYWERDATRDAYLKQLIDACHRNGVLVYAWFEFPHVSEQFWADHPEWREKTALNQDARLDWRKLINLQNEASSKAVAAGFEQLLLAFDWDGVNLAELYFEDRKSTRLNSSH